MRELSMEMLIKKMSRLYVATYLEKQALDKKLNCLAISQLQNHSVSSEIVKLNIRLTESLLMLEKLANIFEKMGLCEIV